MLSKVNVKGSFNVAHAFLPTRNQDATIVSVSAGSAHIDTSHQANGSSYNASKLGGIKFFEIVAAENPDVHVVNMHPGVGTFFTWGRDNVALRTDSS